MKDVWDIVRATSLYLRQLITFLKDEKGVLVIIAGSPCQDNTQAGGSRGYLGFTGTRSAHVHAVTIIVWLVQKMYARVKYHLS